MLDMNQLLNKSDHKVSKYAARQSQTFINKQSGHVMLTGVLKRLVELRKQVIVASYKNIEQFACALIRVFDDLNSPHDQKFSIRHVHSCQGVSNSNQNDFFSISFGSFKSIRHLAPVL